MIIWANKSEIDVEMIDSIEELYNRGGIEDQYFSPDVKLREELKAWELTIVFRQIQKHFGKRRDISILDFGAGASPFGAYLNHLGYQFVTCLDLENGWFPKLDQEIYNEKYDACVRYIKIDITQGYDGRHDVIFSASVLEHIEDKGLRAVQILSKCLKSGGLFIHVADYDRKINFKELIDNCCVSIPYRPEETPGCKEFKNPPEYAIWSGYPIAHVSRVAFFNERQR